MVWFYYEDLGLVCGILVVVVDIVVGLCFVCDFGC